MFYERTLEDYFCKRNPLHLQGEGKAPLVYPEAIIIKPVRVCTVHANWENGKREEEESKSGSVELGLS